MSRFLPFILIVLFVPVSFAQTLIEENFSSSQYWTQFGSTSSATISSGKVIINTNYASSSASNESIRNAMVYRSLCDQIKSTNNWKFEGDFRFSFSAQIGIPFFLLSSENAPWNSTYKCGSVVTNNHDEVVVTIDNNTSSPRIVFAIKNGSTIMHHIVSTAVLSNNTDYHFVLQRTGARFDLDIYRSGVSSPDITISQTISNASLISDLNYVVFAPGADRGWSRSATGEVDNISLTLDTSILVTDLEDVKYCHEDSIKVLGKFRDSSGIYWDTIIGSTGCRSYLRQKLIKTPPAVARTETPINRCAPDFVIFHGDTIHHTGIYEKRFSYKALSCDSLIISQPINIYPSYNQLPAQLSMCAGEDLMLFGKKVTAPGMYSDSLKTIHGCDSIVRIEVTQRPVFQAVLPKIVACGDTSIDVFGMARSCSGIYESRNVNSQGCDSVIVQELEINPEKSTLLSPVSICRGDVVTVFGNSVNEAGIYSRVFKTHKGCDSAVQREVIVNVQDTTQLPDVDICEGQTVNVLGINVNREGTYQRTFTNKWGCDSVVRVRVGFREVNSTLRAENGMLLASEPGATYQWIDCSAGNVDVPGETQQTFRPKTAGNYAVRLIKNGCTVTSACLFVPAFSDTCTYKVFDTTFVRDTIITQINDTLTITVYDTTEVTLYTSVADTLKITLPPLPGCNFVEAKVYPNPATTHLKITFSNYECLKDGKLKLYDAVAQLIWEGTVTQSEMEIPIKDLATGLYLLDCLDVNNQRVFGKKVVIRR